MENLKLNLSKLVCSFLIGVCMACLSGCGPSCGGTTAPCPTGDKPGTVDAQCDLLAGIGQGGCATKEGCRGCPQYWKISGSNDNYSTQCVDSDGNVLSSGDSDYNDCPKCDDSKCPWDKYWVLKDNIKPCGQRDVENCDDPCIYVAVYDGQPGKTYEE